MVCLEAGLVRTNRANQLSPYSSPSRYHTPNRKQTLLQLSTPQSNLPYLCFNPEKFKIQLIHLQTRYFLVTNTTFPSLSHSLSPYSIEHQHLTPSCYTPDPHSRYRPYLIKNRSSNQSNVLFEFRAFDFFCVFEQLERKKGDGLAFLIFASKLLCLAVPIFFSRVVLA